MKYPGRSLYKWQYKCAICRGEFIHPIKLLKCEMIICGKCRQGEAVKNFIHSKLDPYWEEVNLSMSAGTPY